VSTSIFSRFVNGISVGSKSFGMLRKNKKLLLYFIAPAICFELEILLTKAQYLPEDTLTIFKKWSTYDNKTYAIVMLVLFAFELVYILSVMALTYHTNNTQKQEYPGFKKAIKLFIPKIKNGIVWAFINCFIFYFTITMCSSIFIELFPKYTNLISIFSYIFFAILFILIVFTIQILALEGLSVINSIKQSVYIIRKMFFEYLGATFLILLMALITMIFLFILHVSKDSTIIIPFIAYGSAYEVSKTLLYNEFNKRV
jgi:hypothetical protein